MDNKCIAIITARGGSKRIPRKNIKEFLGKPIIAYSIEAAIKSEIFDEIIVSTDDIEIKNIAVQYGAEVPFLRSLENSGDYASTSAVLKEVLGKYHEIGKYYTYMCCIYPTAPFVTAQKLKAALQMLIDTGADSVIPIVPFSFPPQRGMIMSGETVCFMYPEYQSSRSQDLNKMYHDSGQYYCVNVERFLKFGKLVMENTRAIVLDEIEVQDIDNFTDWKIAELKYRMIFDND